MPDDLWFTRMVRNGLRVAAAARGPISDEETLRQRTIEIVERTTGHPSYLATDEEWAAAEQSSRDDPDARVATSEQEASRCSCGKPERGRGPWHAPGRCAMYAGALDLPIEASEQEESGTTTFHCYVCDAPDGECDREEHRARDEQEADDA